ncbi:MAG: hypothetical protein ABIP82_09220 [Nitrospirales bacterium]
MVRWEGANGKELNSLLNDIDGSGPLLIVNLHPFNRQIPVFHQGKARSLNACDAGYVVTQNIGQCGMKPKYCFMVS